MCRRTVESSDSEESLNPTPHLAMIQAIRNQNRLEIEDALVKYDMELLTPDDTGQTALHYAMKLKASKENNTIDILGRLKNYLLDKKIDVTLLDIENNSLLHLAAQNGNLEAYQIFYSLFNSENLAKKNLFQQTPFSIACQKEYFRLIEEIAKNPDAIDTKFATQKLILAAGLKKNILFNTLIEINARYPLHVIDSAWRARMNTIEKNAPSNLLEAMVISFCPASWLPELAEYDPLQASIQYSPTIFTSTLMLIVSLTTLGLLAWAKHQYMERIKFLLLSKMVLQAEVQILKAIPSRLTELALKKEWSEDERKEIKFLFDFIQQLNRSSEKNPEKLGRGTDTSITDQLTTRDRIIIYINMANFALCSVTGLLSLTMAGFAAIAAFKNISVAVLFSTIVMGPIGGILISLIATISLLAIFGYVIYRTYSNREQVLEGLANRIQEVDQMRAKVANSKVTLFKFLQKPEIESDVKILEKCILSPTLISTA